MKTWVDASYAIHDNDKSHTGGVIGFDGLGIISMKSTKQKLTSKSSTEAEVIGASDFLPWTVWLTRFLKAQGYDLNSNIYYQDNQSAIRLESNGMSSSGQRTRHIDIRYFFIKDVIKREKINIHYCPTEKMVADFYTKPLQGKLFKTMRDYIMGHSKFVSSKERVEENEAVDAEKLSIAQNDRKEKLTYADVLKLGIKDNAAKTNLSDKISKTKMVKFGLRDALKSKK